MAPYPPDRRTYVPSRPPPVPPDIRDVKARAAQARAAAQKTIPKRKPVTKVTAAPQMPPWYLTPEQQLELARKQAEAFYQPQLDLYRQQQEYLDRQHQAQQEGLKALYAALAGSFAGVPGQIQGIYREAAQDQSAFGKGYSQGLQLAQDQSAGDTNKLLETIGAPEGQMQNPGTGAADATYAMGGTIPANTLEQQGAAFASAASFLPVKAGLQGQMEFLKAVQQANDEDRQLSERINTLAGQIPGKAQDFLGDIQDQQDAYAKASQPIYRVTSKGVYIIDPDTGSIRFVKGPESASAQTRLSFQTVKGRRVAIDPISGRIVADYGPAGSPPKPSNLQIKTITVGGVPHTVAINPKNGKVVVDYGPAPKSAGKKAGVHYYQDAAGREHAFDPATGVDTILPGGKAPAKPRYTAEKIADFKATAADTAKEAFYGVKHVNEKTGEVVWDLPPQTYQQTLLDLLDHAIPLQIAQNALNRYWKRPGYDRDIAAARNGKVVWYKSGKGRPVRPYQQRQGKGNAAYTAAGSLGRQYASFSGTPTVATHGQQTPKRIIIHTTESSGSPEDVVAGWRSNGLGAQFVIGSDGRVLQTANPSQLTYHAGGMNVGSIGIEIVGAAKYTRKQWMQRPAQLRAIAQTIAALSDAYGIPITYSENGVWTHNDVSKTHSASEGHWDPGPGFPMDYVLRLANSMKGQQAQYVSSKGQGAGRTPASAKVIAKNIAATYGWTGKEWQALVRLGQLESGWDYTAKNPDSGALGIGQALGHELPPDYATNPLTQIRWMLDYIKERYGTPSRALAFWYSKKPPNLPQGNWY